MIPELTPQTQKESVLRLINPSVGPICRTNWKSGHIERNRRIYDYEFVYFSSGNGRVMTESKVFSCTPGDLILIPPGIIHCTVCDSPAERWCIHFDWYGDCSAHYDKPAIFVYLDENEPFDESGVALPPPERLNADFPLKKTVPEQDRPLMMKMLNEYFLLSSSSLKEEFHRQGLLLTILGLALNSDSTPLSREKKRNSHFFQAKCIIDMQFMNSDFTVMQLAAELHLSPNHLTRLFRLNIGFSAHNYLMLRRFSLAKQLLEETDLPVSEIADDCGFEDPNYFARCFRKHAGCAPSAFRNRGHSRISL